MGVESASFEFLHDTLVLCNLFPETGGSYYRSNYYCAGAKTGSKSWVKLPPKYEFLTTKRESTVVDNSLVIIGNAIQQFKINKESVFTGDLAINTPTGDVGGCTVYDEQSSRVLHINNGKVNEIDPSFKAPHKVINTKYINRWMTGCAIIMKNGMRSLVVAGGYPSSADQEWLEFGSTVEVLELDDLKGGKNIAPRIIPASKLMHNNQPAVTQVGSDILVIGGGEVSKEERRCAEKWTGREWTVMDLDCDDLGIRGSPLVTFVPSSFCEY